MANNFLIDAAARQAHWVERYKNRTANVAVESLADVKKAILAEVASGDISSLEAVQELQSVVDEILSAGLSETMGDFSGELKEFGSTQAVFEAATIGKAAKETAKIITPTAAQIWAVANTRPFATKLLRQTFSDFTADAKKLIKNQIQTAFFEGYTLPDLVKSLKGSPQMGLADGAFGNIERKLKLTIRTSISHLASSARDKVYQENSSVVTGVEWVATLDTKTSPVCRGLDGQIFPVDSGQRPPAHPNCRSTTIPVINPDLLLNPDSTGIRPAKGADGRETVSGKETYDSWLRKQPDDFQADVMGEKKAKLFRDGELKMDKFVDDGRELSLVQLQERYPKAWAKAGMDDKPTKIVPPVKPKAKPEIKPKAKPATKTKAKPRNYEKADETAKAWHGSALSGTSVYDKIIKDIELPTTIKRKSSGAYYHAAENAFRGGINMGGKTLGTKAGNATYRHEFGHHFDFQSEQGYTWQSTQPKYSAAMDKDKILLNNEVARLKSNYQAVLPNEKNAQRLIKNGFTLNKNRVWKSLDGKDAAQVRAFIDESLASGSFSRRIFDSFGFDDLQLVEQHNINIISGIIEANNAGDSVLLNIQNMVNHGWQYQKLARETGQLADALEALSYYKTAAKKSFRGNAIFGAGHGKRYYTKEKQMQNIESFAQMFSLHSTEVDEIWQDIARAMFPNQYKRMGRILDGE